MVQTSQKGLRPIADARNCWFSWENWIVYTLAAHKEQMVDRMEEIAFWKRHRENHDLSAMEAAQFQAARRK